MKELHFSIVSDSLLKTHKAKLSDCEYLELSNAREILSKILDHEELYDQVIESYVEAKSTMYEMSVRAISDSVKYDYIKNHSNRSKLNRLYFNVLNFSKLYLDRHFHDGDKKSFVKSITASESSHDEVKKHRQDISKNNPDYIFGCKLRNYVQHASLPVKTFTTGVRWSPEDNQSVAIFHVPLAKKKLIDSGIFSQQMLLKYGEKIDLHQIMDGYIYAISEMHLKSRQLIKNYMEKSLEVINLKRRQIELEHSSSLCDINVVDTEQGVSLFSLHVEWFSVVEHLQKKNLHSLNFKRFTHIPYQ
ncbi:hypothetical protein [Shewanella baltica]|uniref:hypothetical protein n=1 Tax=Shewanella baltica TaxID=62322 RepID=UPI00217E9C44|nr:hypothetical protein [Shewanella baltica]MCS6174766.1 hypothetical protein [Shewanella baltica]